MEGAIYSCPADWEDLLPAGVRRLHRVEELASQCWDLVAFTETGLAQMGSLPVLCRCLLVPGTAEAALLTRIPAAQVVTYGLSPRDSLTLSSLRSPVLCVQRALQRSDGVVIEPQEFPLRQLPAPAERLLPLLGVRLLQMPLTRSGFPW